MTTPDAAGPGAQDPGAHEPDEAQAGRAGAESQHDPTGVELARAIAAQLRDSAAKPGQARSGARTGARPAGAGAAQFSGAHPDDRDPAPVGSVVDRLVADSGWSREISVHSVLGRWAAIVGPDVARHCSPDSYCDGVVSVVADSTAWATQLTLLASAVVARLNAELGDGSVTRIQVRGPGAPSWRKGPRSVRDGRGPRDTYG